MKTPNMQIPMHLKKYNSTSLRGIPLRKNLNKLYACAKARAIFNKVVSFCALDSVARPFYSFAQLFIQKSTVFARIAQYLRNLEYYGLFIVFINEQIDGKFKGPIMEGRSGLKGH